ncbi:MAG: sugar transferase [Clostridia bacterium]|nr:sugar transferase [Clostridia bacterium]
MLDVKLRLLCPDKTLHKGDILIETKIKFSDEVQSKLALEDLDYTNESLKKSYHSFYNLYAKRVIDFTLALIGLLVVWPFMLIIAVAVAVDTGFPVFYKPLRGGYKNKSFNIFKFRTMVKDADKIGSGTTALNDSRITKVGAFLRKTKLDETAQLFNILNGSMSFIGPRPELLKYTDQYDELEKNILNVRPGITDFSSMDFINLDEIVGTDNVDEIYEQYVLKRKNQLRLKYVANVSFKTDLKIFFETVFKVLKKCLKIIKGNK